MNIYILKTNPKLEIRLDKVMNMQSNLVLKRYNQKIKRDSMYSTQCQ